jgi:predicted kinase
VATLFLIVGLPGAGKTTRARELAAEHRALRLTPDEWMIPLFGEPDADGKRDVLEGRLIQVALEVLRLGTSAVLDFGFWSRDERSALRWLASSTAGGRSSTSRTRQNWPVARSPARPPGGRAGRSGPRVAGRRWSAAETGCGIRRGRAVAWVCRD